MSRIRQEIRQRRPFPSRGQEGAVALLRTADLVRRFVAAVLEPHDLTLQQYNVLRILRGAGAEGLPTLEVGVRMIEQAPGVTRLLDRIEAKGLVSRERCPHDRRQVTCRITPAGLALVARLDQPVLEADDACFSKLSAKELDKLIQLLDAVRSSLHPPSQPEE
ncbi:MAG: MarR family transcriptional regulator [Vicinamibacteria bacterium]|nr:MarR family transcriptional regulator [Vicinamibacteria bacterium]